MNQLMLLQGDPIEVNFRFIKEISKAWALQGEDVIIIVPNLQKNVKFDFVNVILRVEHKKIKKEFESGKSERIKLVSLGIRSIIASRNIENLEINYFSEIKSASDCSEKDFEEYVGNFLNRTKQAIQHFKIDGILAIDMPAAYIARQITVENKVNYGIKFSKENVTSSIKPPAELLKYTLDAISNSKVIFVQDYYSKLNIIKAFKDFFVDIETKIKIVENGIDTKLYALYNGTKASLQRNLLEVSKIIKDFKDGRRPEHGTTIEETLKRGALSKMDLIELSEKIQNLYNPYHPDYNFLEKLRTIRWENRPLIGYIGGFSATSGIFDLIFSIPQVLQMYDVDFIILGYGVYREFVEMIIKAIEMKNYGLVRLILETSRDQAKKENLKQDPFDGILTYLKQLKEENKLIEFFDIAQKLQIRKRIKILGFTPEIALAKLLPLLDIIVVPTLSPTASSSFALSGIASGLIPILSQHLGLKHIIESICNTIIQLNCRTITIPMDPRTRIRRLILDLKYWIALSRKGVTTPVIKRTIRRVAEMYYSWDAIAKMLKSSILSKSLE